MKLILSLVAFLTCFFIMNWIIISLTGYAKDDAFFIISELLSDKTLAETGRGIVNFVGFLLVIWDGIVGLIGALYTYYYLADKVLDLLPFYSNGEE